MSGELSSQINELRLLLGSPRDPEGRAFAQLGDALRRAGELQEALGVLKDGVARHPDFTPGHLALAWALQSGGETDGALAAFHAALELDPENPYALFGAGSLLASRGDEEGVRMVETALALDPAVRSSAPPPPWARREQERPFVPLAELAPAAVERERPFLTLSELAPAASGAERPFVALAELAPAVVEPERPFVSLDDLAPDTPADVPVERDDPREPVFEEDEPDEADASPVTRTMAELFASQGFPDRAIRIYERLLEDAPGEPALLERLAELRSEAGEEESVVPEPAISTADDEAEADGGDDAGARHPALEVPEPLPLSPSPYGWEGDGEATPPPLPAASAGAYFGRLLSWAPGSATLQADQASEHDPGGEPAGGEER